MASFQKLLIALLLVFLHCTAFVCSNKIDVNSKALTQKNIVPSDELRRIEELQRQSADVTKKTAQQIQPVNIYKKALTQMYVNADAYQVDATKKTQTRTNFIVNKDMKETFDETWMRVMQMDITKDTLTQTNFIDSDYVKELKEAVEKYTPQKIDLTKETFVQSDRQKAKGLSLIVSNIINDQRPMQAIAKGIVDLLKAYFVKPNLNFDISVYKDLPNATQEQLDHVYEAWHRDNTTNTLPLRTKRQESTKDPDNQTEYLIDSPALVFIDQKYSEDFVRNATINYNFNTELRYLLFIEKQPEDEPIDKMYLDGFLAPFIDIIYKDGNRLSLWTHVWSEECRTTIFEQINEFDMNTLE
jgi:hypothetical protein